MRLTELQKQEIIKLFKLEKTIVEISKTVKCSRPTVVFHIKNNGFELRGQKSVITPQLEMNVCKLYLEDKKSGRFLAKKFNVSLAVIQKIIKNNNIKPRKIRYNYDESKFFKISSEEDAYWLGFIFADGGVKLYKNTKYKKGKMYLLKLRLALKDLSHLEKFKNYINTNAPIKFEKYKGNNCCILEINNKSIVNNVLKLGCIPNKSYKIRMPFLKKTLIRHFIRGYIDGDGWYTIDKIEKRFSIGFLSNKNFVLDMDKFLVNNLSISNGTVSKRTNTYQILYRRKKDMLKLWKFLYVRSKIYLERKKKVFLNYKTRKNSMLIRINSNHLNRF